MSPVFQGVSLLSCPYCREALACTDHSASCPRGHCFDIARQGYINLLAAPPPRTKYSKELFQARRRAAQAGLFDPLLEHLAAAIAELTSPGVPFRILDAGCGDGSLFSGVVRRLYAEERPASGVGLDIAKEAVKLAAQKDPSLGWCVGDLARLPFQSGCFDVVLNILSPANYAEFKRVLTPDGVLFKIAPGPRHFLEFRNALPSSRSSGAGSGDDVLKLVRRHFKIVRFDALTYTVDLDIPTLALAVKMSPLAWHIPEQQLPDILDRLTGADGKTGQLTLDYALIRASCLA